MRYDKYDGMTSGYRTILAEDFAPGDLDKGFGVGHDANGHCVIGESESGVKGLLILTKVRYEGEVVDVMTDGEVVEVDPTAFPPGSNVFAEIDGDLSTTKGTTGVYIGHVVERGRMVVRVERGAVAS